MNLEGFIAVFKVDSNLFCFTAFKELCGNLIEQSITEDILFLLCIGCRFLFKLFKLGLDVICGAAGYRLFLGLFCGGYVGVLAIRLLQSFEFLGNALVSFTVEHIHNGLCSDDL